MEPSTNHTELVERIISVRSVLQGVIDPDKRNALLDELGAATRELAKFILEKEGRLKSPSE